MVVVYVFVTILSHHIQVVRYVLHMHELSGLLVLCALLTKAKYNVR